jgi:cobalt-precorrin 5A hydrolase
MSPEPVAVVAITRLGVKTSLKIKFALDSEGLQCSVYAPKKYSQNSVIPIEGSVAEFIKENYGKVKALVGVMATGIIIRAVAPYLENKLSDPAVIGVDASGKFVISLLSGHYGGANQLTKTIAKGIGATPVITTASDVAGKLCVEDLAKILRLTIVNPASLVAVNSAIVNGDRVVLVLLDKLGFPKVISGFEVKEAGSVKQALEIVDSYTAGAIVTNQPLEVGKAAKPFTVLKPKRFVVGLGSRKASTTESIIAAVNTALEQANLPVQRVCCFATVDIKKASVAMYETARHFGVPLEFLSVDNLSFFIHNNLSPDSEMVKEKIGVGGVSERAALIIAGKNSNLILKKTKLNGVTVAIAQAE